ncbi:hypothetical protein [Streptococcus dysgalactiae]|nr:hypothetical protein [Streptococcus dysgalactiae]
MIINHLNARLVVIWSLFLFFTSLPLFNYFNRKFFRTGSSFRSCFLCMDVSSHSLSAILLALFHKELDPSQGLIKSTGEAALIIFLAVAAFSMLFLSGWLTSRIKILDFIKKKLESYLKHEQAIWIHRLMLLATALIFIHVLLIPEVTQNKFFCEFI